MFQNFLEWYHLFAKENPIVASAFGVGLGGWALMMLKTTPFKLFNFIKGRFVTTLSLNSGGHGERTTIAFMQWFNTKSNWGHLSRNFALTNPGNEDDPVFVSGFGTNFFFWRRRLFWFNKSKLDSSGTYNEKYEIVISMLGRDQQLLKDLVNVFKYRKSADHLTIHQYRSSWNRSVDIRKRPRESVILQPSVYDKIFGRIDDFIDSKKWYHDRALPYKLCFMFTGPPGSGKTSLAKAIGSHYDRDVFPLSLAGMTDTKLHDAITSVPPGSVIQMEDFESSPATRSRTLTPLTPSEVDQLKEFRTLFNFDIEFGDLGFEYQSTINQDYPDESTVKVVEVIDSPEVYFYWDKFSSTPSVDHVVGAVRPIDRELYETVKLAAELYNRHVGASDQPATQNGLSLTGLLNVLDGIVPLDDQIIILSTNHPEKLDEAIVRKGRVDHIVELGLLGDAEVRRYIELMFPGHAIEPGLKFNPIAGCNLQAIFYENKHVASDFVDAIPKE